MIPHCRRKTVPSMVADARFFEHEKEFYPWPILSLMWKYDEAKLTAPVWASE